MSDFIKNIKDENNNLVNYIVLFLLLLIFTFKSGGSNFLNGLPITNKHEIFLFIFLLPFTLYVNIFFYKNFIIKVLIFFAFLLKLSLIFYPSLGIIHKQFQLIKENNSKILLMVKINHEIEIL